MKLLIFLIAILLAFNVYADWVKLDDDTFMNEDTTMEVVSLIEIQNQIEAIKTRLANMQSDVDSQCNDVPEAYKQYCYQDTKRIEFIIQKQINKLSILQGIKEEITVIK